MKILYLTTYYLPYISGLTMYAKRLTEGLKNKHNISILSIKYDKKLLKSEVSDGINIYRADYLFKISKGFASIEVIEKSLSLIDRNDILIVNQPCFEGLFAVIYARIMGKKTISVFHCFVNISNSYFDIFASLLMNIITYIQLIFSNKIVIVSRDYVEQFTLMKIFENKMVEIGPPISIKKPNQNFKEKLISLKKKHQWIGFCGRISREKNIETLIDALKI